MQHRACFWCVSVWMVGVEISTTKNQEKFFYPNFFYFMNFARPCLLVKCIFLLSMAVSADISPGETKASSNIAAIGGSVFYALYKVGDIITWPLYFLSRSMNKERKKPNDQNPEREKSQKWYTKTGFFRDITSSHPEKKIDDSTLKEKVGPWGLFIFLKLSTHSAEAYEEFVRYLLGLMLFLGVFQTLYGKGYAFFNLHSIVFIYLFFPINSLLVPQIESFTGTSPDADYLNSSSGPRVLYTLLSTSIISFFLSFVVRFFTKSMLVASMFWFFLFGPGNELLLLVSPQNSMLAILGVVFFCLLALKKYHKNIEAYVFQLIFGFMGSVFIFFSISEFFRIPLVIPQIVLNHRAHTTGLYPYEWAYLLASTLFTLYLQSSKI